MLSRLLSRIFPARRRARPYHVVLAGKGQPCCIAHRATLDTAHQAFNRAVDYYRQQEGFVVIAREPFAAHLSKYLVDLDIFVELTLSVEYSEPITQSAFSLN